MQAHPAQFMKGRPERRRQFVAFSKRMSHRFNETILPAPPHHFDSWLPNSFTPHSITPRLTAVLRALATVCTTFASLLAQEATAHDCQAGHQATAVLLLLRRRSLLHGRRLLVAHLLRRVAILLGRWWAAVALLVLTLGRAVGLLRVLRTAVVVALACHCVRCAYAIGCGWVVLLGCARSAAVSLRLME